MPSATASAHPPRRLISVGRHEAVRGSVRRNNAPNQAIPMVSKPGPRPPYQTTTATTPIIGVNVARSVNGSRAATAASDAHASTAAVPYRKALPRVAWSS